MPTCVEVRHHGPRAAGAWLDDEAYNPVQGGDSEAAPASGD